MLIPTEFTVVCTMRCPSSSPLSSWREVRRVSLTTWTATCCLSFKNCSGVAHLPLQTHRRLSTVLQPTSSASQKRRLVCVLQ